MFEPTYVKLRTQTQLCERLAHLTRFSSLFIFVAGESGAGKSTLAQQYLELQPDVNQALINCSAGNSVFTLRQQLITQLYPSATFDADESLPTLFQQFLATPAQNLLLVIDDAELLPDAFLAELWQLQSDNRVAGYPHQINILLFAVPEWANLQFSLLKQGSEEPPIELEIAALSPEESRDFIQFHLQRVGQLVPDSAEKMQQLIEAGLGIPGLLYQALFPEEPHREPKSQPFLPFIDLISKLRIEPLISSFLTFCLSKRVMFVLLFAVAMLLSLVVYFQFIVEDEAPEAIAVELNLDRAVAEEQQSTELTAALSEQRQHRPEKLVSQWDSSKQPKALPEPLEKETLTLETEPQGGKRVLVPDEKVNQLLAQQRQEQANTGADENVEPKAQETEHSSQDELQKPQEVKKQPQQQSMAKKQPAIEKPAAVKTAPVAGLVDPKSLTSIAKTHYTIQLSGLSSLTMVKRFIAENSLSGKVWAYETRYKGKPWFVVIMGDYANVEASRAAIAKLPLHLKALSPWSKSFAAVHKDLEKVRLSKP